MFKCIAASCTADGRVFVGALEIVDAVIQSEGTAASTGLLLLQDDVAYYFPSSASDIKTTIEKLSAALADLTSALTTVSTTLTGIGAGMTGPTTAPPPTLSTDVASINAKIAEVNTTKTELDTLAGALK